MDPALYAVKVVCTGYIPYNAKEHTNAIIKARKNPNLRDAYLDLIKYLEEQKKELEGERK